jgi:hypothetical protein
MADNSQTTDPLAPENDVEGPQVGDVPVPWDAEETLPDTVRDPGKGNTGGAPTWQGSQASDF